LSSLVVEREAAGGQAGQSTRIENYLGFPAGLSGADLSRRAITQARRFGAEMLLANDVDGIEPHQGGIGVHLNDGRTLLAHSVIVATGVSYRRLTVPGADDLTGRGVFYGAAVSETPTVRGEQIHIVGAANSAGQAALHFANVASKVTMLVRGDGLSASMSHYLAERILATGNIEIRYNVTVERVSGDDHVESIALCNAKTGEMTIEATSGVFVFIGASPHTEWLSGTVACDDRGFVLTGADVVARSGAWRLDRAPYLMETSVPGVFAAGDVRLGSGKRVATAVGEGAAAVMAVWQYRTTMGL
jgi:thioredoxin reductase (NADPH)